MESWFKPLAYALILLREGGYPCIFYGDYYGAHYKDTAKDGNEYEIWMDSHQTILDHFLYARKTFSYGEQHDYFDHPSTIGWVRLGDDAHPGGMAVVLTNGEGGSKRMNVGHPNCVYVDVTEQVKESVTTDDEGWADFSTNGGSVSVWLPQS